MAKLSSKKAKKQKERERINRKVRNISRQMAKSKHADVPSAACDPKSIVSEHLAMLNELAQNIEGFRCGLENVKRGYQNAKNVDPERARKAIETSDFYLKEFEKLKDPIKNAFVLLGKISDLPTDEARMSLYADSIGEFAQIVTQASSVFNSSREFVQHFDDGTFDATPQPPVPEKTADAEVGLDFAEDEAVDTPTETPVEQHDDGEIDISATELPQDVQAALNKTETSVNPA